MNRPVPRNTRMTRQDYFVLAGFVGIVVAAVTALYFLHREPDKQKTAELPGRERYDGKHSVHYAQDGANDGSMPADIHIGKLQYFDPNTADSTVLLGLGLRPWQVRSIYKYRAHGGRYYAPEDFAQLYGLTLKHYQILRPYIRIKAEVMARDVVTRHKYKRGDSYGSLQKNDANLQSATAQAPQVDYYATHPRQEKIRQGQTIDINSADTTELKKIPGIGSYYARRIVELRKRRGAFVSESDLLAIRNFPETALEYMKASQNFPSVHINSATLAELERHPLINHTQATDILSYRRLKGRITSISNMTNLPSFTAAQLSRLERYLVFQ